MKQDELKEHILKTYFWSRVGIAAISILFPLVLWFVGLSLNVHLQGSISAYYHTPMRDVFVGSLFAIGAFLYLYRGYSTVENIALDFAGIFAIGVAILPTSAISEPKCDTFTAPYLHGVCAILFFIAIAYVCIFQSSETLKEMIDESRRKFYEILYNTNFKNYCYTSISASPFSVSPCQSSVVNVNENGITILDTSFDYVELQLVCAHR